MMTNAAVKCPVCLHTFVKNAIRHLVLSEKFFTFAAGKTASDQEVRYAIPIRFGRVALPAASFNELHPPSGLYRFRAAGRVWSRTADARVHVLRQLKIIK